MLQPPCAMRATPDGMPTRRSSSTASTRPANIPIAFETTILFAAFSTLIGMLAFNGLPRLSHPLFRSKRFKRVTNDGLFISIEAADPNFDQETTRRLLQEAGAVFVEEVEG